MNYNNKADLTARRGTGGKMSEYIIVGDTEK